MEKNNKEIDHQYTKEVVCPYCGYEYSDSWEWSDEGEDTCVECKKIFTWRRDIEVTYVSEKDCIKNKQEHQFSDRIDRESGGEKYQVCSLCGEVKIFQKQNKEVMVGDSSPT